MSFASAARTFSAQAARDRRDLIEASIQPLTDAEANDGNPVTVSMTPPKAEQEITDNGVSVVVKSQLRVIKGGRWTPADDSKFRVIATGEIFKCRNATGATSEFSAEIVCDCVRISVS